MSSPAEGARCVWLTREQRDVLVALQEHRENPNTAVAEILAAYDRAPADPVEAVMIALYAHDKPDVENEGVRQDQAVAVLRALGFPSASQPTGDDT